MGAQTLFCRGGAVTGELTSNDRELDTLVSGIAAPKGMLGDREARDGRVNCNLVRPLANGQNSDESLRDRCRIVRYLIFNMVMRIFSG